DLELPTRVSLPVQSRSGYLVWAPFALIVSSRPYGASLPTCLSCPLQLPLMLGPAACGAAARLAFEPPGWAGSVASSGPGGNCAEAGAITASIPSVATDTQTRNVFSIARLPRKPARED